MALHATQKPYKPHQPHRAIPSPHRGGGLKQAAPRANPVLSNLSAISGGTPPGGAGAAAGSGASPGQTVEPWAADPVLQQIKNLQQANVAAAEAQAVAARNQALINFGYDPGMASIYGDAGTAGSAKANPFSVLSQLQHAHELTQRNLNENLNKSNLFYSGYRGQQLGEEGRNYLGQQYTAGQNLQSLLGQINEKKLGAQQTAQGAITQGNQDAYNRWLDQQLQYGLGSVQPPAGGYKARPVKRPATPNLKGMF